MKPNRTPQLAATGRRGSMAGAPIKMAIVHDHPLIREGVANTLRRCGTMQLVAEGESARDALDIAMTHRPDIMLLDVVLPGGGIEAARAIAMACPRVKVV